MYIYIYSSPLIRATIGTLKIQSYMRVTLISGLILINVVKAVPKS